MRERQRGKTLVLAAALFFSSSIITACSPTTYKASTFRRTVTTYIDISTNVPSQVWISNLNVGTTPVSFPFTYEEEVDRQVTTANYWETNPGTAAALTVLSFGLYLPFSVASVEPTAEFRPTGRYINNKVNVRAVAEGYEPLEHSLEAQGEPKVVLKFDLAKSKK